MTTLIFLWWPSSVLHHGWLPSSHLRPGRQRTYTSMLCLRLPFLYRLWWLSQVAALIHFLRSCIDRSSSVALMGISLVFWLRRLHDVLVLSQIFSRELSSVLGCFDFSFAKVGEARALQVPLHYFHTKCRHAFRIFFFTPGRWLKKMWFFRILLEIPCILTLPLPTCGKQRKNYKSSQSF